MSDHCPTCGSSQPWMDRSPHAQGGSWDQWPRAGATFVCPDFWHEATEATASTAEAAMSDDDLLLIGDHGTVRCKRSDVEQMIADGYVIDNGDGTVEVTETGKYYIATRARFG